MNENQKNNYKLLRQKRVEALKTDPGDWSGGGLCSFCEAKKSNPELHDWYVQKSKMNHKVYLIEEEIRELESQLIESMEEKICKPGNIVVYRNTPTPYYKNLNFFLMEKSGRDDYLLFNSTNNRFHKVHWKSLVKNYKLSEISE